MDIQFEKYLKQLDLSQNTIIAYLYTIKQFEQRHKTFSTKNLLLFKSFLIETYKPKTVNLRIQALNKYLEFLNKKNLKLKSVKLQQTNHLENIISNTDYRYFKQQLKKDGNLEWYFTIRFLASTGARVSELVQLKAEHVRQGYYDIYCKGGKVRRLMIPRALRREALEWLNQRQYTSGPLFLNRFGEPITPRGIGRQLKCLALKYGINPKVVYPHTFRHRFAKNFLEKFHDLALLADLLGHENIETTRIYLRRTSEEQQDIIDRIVTW